MDKQKAMERLDAIEKEAKALRAEIDKPEAKEPKWKSNPELLVGKLCRVWDDAGDSERLAVIDSIDTGDTRLPYRDNKKVWWQHAEPITSAEIQAMTYRESRYDWSKVPDWVNYVCMSNSEHNPGLVKFFKNKPNIEMGGMYEDWLNADGYGNLSMVIGNISDWRDSLEHRPEGI